MKSFYLVYGLVILSLVSCASKTASTDPSANSNQPTPAEWQEKMQQLSKTLTELLPIVSSREKFSEPANRDLVLRDTQKLQGLAHDLKGTDKPNSDPSLNLMTGLFEDDINRALAAFQHGNADQARDILKDTTSYCIQCHTQTNQGPDFPRMDLNVDTSTLSHLEQADYFAATRQFERALAEFKKIIMDKEIARTSPHDWESALRASIAIAVRVKKDPKLTLSIIKAAQSNPNSPRLLHPVEDAWRKSVSDWQKSKIKASSNEDKLKLAGDLIQTAQKRQRFPLDHTQDIAFFRASELLHEILASGTQSTEMSSEALLLAGEASEATRDMTFWTLHQTYYEQCIRTSPHSAIAEKCYDHLRDSVTFGYSGSNGTEIPNDVQTRLNSFRDMAQPNG